MNTKPESFYKYCPINDSSNLEKEYSLINLFNNQVVFSTRKNFNDLFDSKIEFIKPTKNELRELLPLLSKSGKHDLKKDYFGKSGGNNISQLVREINKKFDEYLFYCVSDDGKNNLMWAHYASSHKGFCIEWDSEKIQAQKVTYKKDIASFKLLDLIKHDLKINNKNNLGIEILNALRVKLSEWEYENEYRFHLGNSMQLLVKDKGNDFSLVSHEPEWIKSITFGCRMDQKTRQYIIENLPYKVRFKEVVEGKSNLMIKNIK